MRKRCLWSLTCALFFGRAMEAAPFTGDRRFHLEYTAGYAGSIGIGYRLTQSFGLGLDAGYGYNYFFGSTASNITAGGATMNSTESLSHDFESFHGLAFVTFYPWSNWRLDLGPRYAVLGKLCVIDCTRNYGEFYSMNINLLYQIMFHNCFFSFGFRVSPGWLKYYYTKSFALSSIAGSTADSYTYLDLFTSKFGITFAPLLKITYTF